MLTTFKVTFKQINPRACERPLSDWQIVGPGMHCAQRGLLGTALVILYHYQVEHGSTWPQQILEWSYFRLTLTKLQVLTSQGQVLKDIFNISPSQSAAPTCMKPAGIIQLSQSFAVTGLHDCMPVARTLIVMKLVMSHIKSFFDIIVFAVDFNSTLIIPATLKTHGQTEPRPVKQQATKLQDPQPFKNDP